MQIQVQNEIQIFLPEPAVLGASTPSSPTNFHIDDSSLSGDVLLTWNAYPGALNIEIWKSVNGGPYALYATIAGASVSYHDVAGLAGLAYWEYKIRAILLPIDSSFSIPAAIFGGLNNHFAASISYPYLEISLGIIDLSANGNLVSISFPRLRKIISDLTAGRFDANFDTSLTSIDLSSLVSVDEIFNLSITRPANLSFPNLVSVGGFFSVAGMALLQTISAPNLVSVGGDITLNGNPVLTTISLPALTSAASLIADTNPDLSSVDLSMFQMTNSGDFDFDGVGASVLSFPVLATVANVFTIRGPNLTSISCPSLTSVEGGFVNNCPVLATLDLSALTQTTADNLDLSNNPALTSLDLDSLVTVGSEFTVANCTALASVGLANFSSCGGGFTFDNSGITMIGCPNAVGLNTGAGSISGNGLSTVGCSNLVTILIPSVALTITGGVACNSCPSLTNLTFSNFAAMFQDGTTITFDGDALTDTSVNLVLACGVNSGVTTCDFELANGTNAAPSGQGIVDKATLQGAGNTVNTN